MKNKGALGDFLQLPKKPHFERKNPPNASFNVAFLSQMPQFCKKGALRSKEPHYVDFSKPTPVFCIRAKT